MTVVEALKERYGDPQVAIFSYFEAMLAVSPASHEIAKLQAVFDECEKHIRSLVALGLPEETFGQVFTPIVLSKLPKFVRMELHRRNGSKAWTLSKLRELLKDEIHARDLSQRSFGGIAGPVSTDASGTPLKSGSQESGGAKSRSQRPPRFTSTSSSLVASSADKKIRCSYCDEQHYSDQCSAFPDVVSRRRQLDGRCLSCLMPNHRVRDCRHRRPCAYCKKSGHHRSLCEEKFGSKTSKPKQPNSSLPVGAINVEPPNCGILNAQSPEFVPMAGTTNLLSHGGKAILQTATAKLVGARQQSARLLFDTGCSRSFVTSRLCRDIGARFKGEEVIAIAGFSDTKRKTVKYKIYEFDVILRDGGRKTVTANATDVLTCPVQQIPLDVKSYPFIKMIPLAEPLISAPQMVEIDVLIGGDYYYDFISSEQIKCSSGLVFLSSTLGYIAAGRVDAPPSARSSASAMLLSKIDSVPDSNFDLERFWKLEDIGIKDPHDSTDDELALKFFNDTIRFNANRYEVKWPWKQGADKLANNYGLSCGRLKSLLKRLEKTPEVLQKYDATIQEQFAKGIIELAPGKPDGEQLYYIPHHCVITPQKTTTKLRVVYDASSKGSSSELSLNECVHRGPVMLADLCGLLIRFRKNVVFLVADIEKAFLQVVLQKPDRDVTRFLWVKDLSAPPTADNIVIYRFCRVPFGINASSFMLAGTIAHHLTALSSPVALEILENVYVDNVLGGRQSTSGAIEYYAEAKSIFNGATMNLREWYSNDSQFMARIAESDRGKGTSTKVLGVKWELQTDTLHCSVGNFDVSSVSTKRQFLKAVASIFDPCGFFAPITVTGKILLQEIWKAKYGWDDPLPPELIETSTRVLSDFQRIPEFSIPRQFSSLPLTSSSSYELHCFCDASAKAYSAVVYVRVESDLQVATTLVFAKSRVCPAKALSIPRLELLAVLIGTRILTFVESQLQLVISKKYLWSDSQCVLHWVLGREVSTVFVRNRVNEIRTHTSIKYGYVPTDQNPADLPSRGMDFLSLSQSSLWWSGPSWLQVGDMNWPTTLVKFGVNSVGLPSPQEPEIMATGVECPDFFLNISRFSSLLKLLRVTAWARRFIERSRKVGYRSGALNAGEIESARWYWIKAVQKAFFSEIFVQKLPIVVQLGLFVDENGLIRCKGRYSHAEEIPEASKYPILLPNRMNDFTRLVILDCHERLGHAMDGWLL